MKIATAILEGEDPTPQDVRAFIESCPNALPGRELLIKVATAATPAQ